MHFTSHEIWENHSLHEKYMNPTIWTSDMRFPWPMNLPWIEVWQPNQFHTSFFVMKLVIWAECMHLVKNILLHMILHAFIRTYMHHQHAHHTHLYTHIYPHTNTHTRLYKKLRNSVEYLTISMTCAMQEGDRRI